MREPKQKLLHLILSDRMLIDPHAAAPPLLERGEQGMGNGGPPKFYRHHRHQLPIEFRSFDQYCGRVSL